MSPGATFERVYTELRRMLAEGELPPGSPIEPAAVGRQIASSITPVRDALHRLTGERLVEAPNHNGFRVPLITEAELRDLYQWHAQLLILAARQIRPSQAAVEATGPSLGEEPASAMPRCSAGSQMRAVISSMCMPFTCSATVLLPFDASSPRCSGT